MQENGVIKILPSVLHNNASFQVSGFKHAIVGIISASVLHPETHFTIYNVPLIDDVKVMTSLLKSLGAEVSVYKDRLEINTRNMHSYKVDEKFCKDVHGVIYLLPSLLGRFGKVEIFECGGCQIGSKLNLGKRPISHMLTVMKSFGYKCQHIDNKIIAERISVPSNCHLDILEYSDDKKMITGQNISGATKTAILASMSTGCTSTLISNPYPKPDVIELMRLAVLLDYDVTYDKHKIAIKRTEATDNIKNVKFTVIDDLSAIMTYICLAIFHDISIEICNINTALLISGLKEEFDILKKMGVNLYFSPSSIKVPRISKLKAVDINVTSTGIYSDHQPFFALLMTMADGEACIREKVWKNRFTYAVEMKKLGYHICVNEGYIRIKPGKAVQGETTLYAGNLRSAAVLLIAGLKEKHATTLHGGHHLSRGYENLQQSLIDCGANLAYV